MAASVNKVILVGNLGRDPEVRTMQNGNKVANISVATSDRWKDKNTGEMNERTEWHRVVMFDRLAEIAEQYLRKGSKVYLEGQLQTRKWEDQNGQEKYSTEVVLRGFNANMTMLDGRTGGGGGGYEDAPGGGGGSGGGSGGGGGGGGPSSGPAPEFDDEIPF